MDYSQLETMSVKELREIMKTLDLENRRSRDDMITDIRKERDEQYIRHEQLGDAGKDAVTYLVKVGGKKYAMKTFKKRKSSKQIQVEVDLQLLVHEANACPRIIDYDLERKYIVMDKLERHLIDITGKKEISLDHQKQLIKLYQKMDDIGVFHGDPNPLNYMIKGKKLFVIDFGMSKKITPAFIKKMGTDSPNEEIMTLAMVLKLKNMNYPASSYSYLLDFIDKDYRKKLKL
jgi:tRNA A-37 threonylcarbamoyl transferase component Bud32